MARRGDGVYQRARTWWLDSEVRSGRAPVVVDVTAVDHSRCP
jgi:hypothetical protein